jgi:hypothetical protein
MVAIGRIIGLLFVVLGVIAGLGAALIAAQDKTLSATAVITLLLQPLVVIGIGAALYLLADGVQRLDAIHGALTRAEVQPAPHAPTVPEPDAWLVIGTDARGNPRRVPVRAGSREDAFAVATRQGIVKAQSIERQG